MCVNTCYLVQWTNRHVWNCHAWGQIDLEKNKNGLDAHRSPTIGPWSYIGPSVLKRPDLHSPSTIGPWSYYIGPSVLIKKNRTCTNETNSLSAFYRKAKKTEHARTRRIAFRRFTERLKRLKCFSGGRVRCVHMLYGFTVDVHSNACRGVRNCLRVVAAHFHVRGKPIERRHYVVKLWSIERSRIERMISKA